MNKIEKEMAEIISKGLTQFKQDCINIIRNKEKNEKSKSKRIKTIF